jgi:hypothetical protein
VSNVYGDVEIDRNKHIHKKRKLAEGREKPMVILSDLIINTLHVVCGLPRKKIFVKCDLEIKLFSIITV